MRCLWGALFCLVAATQPTRAQTDSIPVVAQELFAYDRTAPLDVQDTVAFATDHLTVHDLTYASPRGGRVTAYLVVPRGEGPFAGLVFGHWGYGTRTEFLPEASVYAEAGAVSILIDYPWTRPAPWRRTTNDLADAAADVAVYAQAVVDLERAVDLLTSRPDVDPRRIAYVGHSYGAQWGAILAVTDRRIRAAVLVAGVGSLADIYLDSDDPAFVQLRATAEPGQIQRYLDGVGVLDAIRWVPFTAPTPLLFQFAIEERFFDAASMQHYAAAALEPKTVLWYHSGHELNDVRVLGDRARWLERQVGLHDMRQVLHARLGW